MHAEGAQSDPAGDEGELEDLMLDFVSQHSDLINTLANVGMLFVWVF